MTKHVFGIEGLDRLGKSTLIEGIRNKLGYYEVVHFSKPQHLAAYGGAASVSGVPPHSLPSYHYQRAGFLNSMLIARSGARIIFDRWHLGEVVYAPMYRGYSGDYVFQQELNSGLADTDNARLILLTEDFRIAEHFVDDGNSVGPAWKREEEQGRFIAAFERSNIRDKRIICVTDQAFGSFRSKDWILHEALA